MQENNWDIVITGGTLMTMSAGMEIIEDSIIGIKDGLIVAVGQNKDSGYASTFKQKKRSMPPAVSSCPDWSIRTRICRWFVSGAWLTICR